MKKVKDINVTTKRFREIFITTLEQMIIDLRDGKIDTILMATINYTGEIDHYLYTDKAKENYLKTIGLAAEILKERQECPYG